MADSIMYWLYWLCQVGVPDVTCLIYEAKDGGPVQVGEALVLV